MSSWRFVVAVSKRFIQHKGTDATAILAYTSLIGVVPMLAVMLSLFSTSSWFEPMQRLIMNLVVAHLIPDSQPMIQHYLNVFAGQASRLALPGLVIMLITTLMLLWTVDQKINAMWSDAMTRRWWVSLINYLGISLLGPILLGLSLFVSSYLVALPLMVNQTWLLGFNHLFSLLPFILSTFGFMLLYRFVPIAKIRWNQAWWVGLMAALQIEFLKWGFGWYIKAFPTYDLVYGALAAIPVFLLWIYLIWFIVIWNACVLSEWSQRQADSDTSAN